MRRARCWIRTKAIPGSAGRFLNNCVNASSPPAEAPTPTIGNWLLVDDLAPACLGKADVDLSLLDGFWEAIFRPLCSIQIKIKLFCAIRHKRKPPV